jgi:nucleoside-diphosphate-sugar epimerase
VDIIRSGNGIIIGNGLNHLCLVYATDVADAFLLAGNPSIPAGKPYTIGGVEDKNPITQKEYMNSIAQLIGAPAPRIYLPFKVAIALSTAMESTWHFLRIRKPPLITSFAVHLLGRDQVFDTSFAQRSLGWAPQVSFADGMRETLACLDQEYKNSAKE